MKNARFLLLFSTLFSFTSVWAQQGKSIPEKMAVQQEEMAVRNAILDYVEALYLADSTRIEKSVHPELRKIGYWYDKKNKVYHDNLEMTYEELVALSASWNSSGQRANEKSPKEIIIFEVNDKTAIAKLTAEWGIDYFQLAKSAGKWRIMNVIWQSIP